VPVIGWVIIALAVVLGEVLCGAGVAAAPVLMPALVAGAVLAVAILLRPQVGYLLAVFLLIFPHLTLVSSGAKGSGGFEAVHLVVLLTAVGWLAAGLLSEEKRVRIFDEPLTPPLILLVGWVGITLWWAPDFAWGIYLWLQVVFGLVFYLLGARLISTRRLLQIMAVVWTLNGVVLVILQLVVMYVPSIGSMLTGTIFRVRDVTGARPTGLMQPNIMALYLNLSVVAAMAVFLSVKKRLRLWAGLAVLAMVVADVLTFSRGGWLGLAGGIVFFLVYSAELRRSAIRFGVPALALLMAIFIFYQGAAETFSRRAGAMSSPEQIGAMQIRFRFWQEVRRLTGVTEGMGVGVGGFTKAVSEYVRSFHKSPHMGVYSHPHCIYLLVIFDLGLIGLAILAWLMTAIAMALRRVMALPIGPWEKHSVLAFAAGFTAIAVHGLIDLVYYDRLIWAFLGFGGAALNVALAAHRSSVREREEVQSQEARLAPEAVEAV